MESWFSSDTESDNSNIDSDSDINLDLDSKSLNDSWSNLNIDLSSTDDADLMSDVSSQSNKVDLAEKIQNLIRIYTVQEVLAVIEPIFLLYNVDEFFIPDTEKIQLYVKAFNKLFRYHSEIMNELFKLHKVLPQTSANGRVWVIKLDKASLNVPKLLIKQPLDVTKSDPISYEYYIGTTLNKLREINIPNFSIVYGRLHLENANYVLYEYIRDKNDDTKTLYKYIKDSFKSGGALKEIEVNLASILCLLLLSLQYSQDKFQFTHYDSHLQNILVVKLKHMYKFNYSYNGKNYVLYSEYMPYVIDYGRSHIDPTKVYTEDNVFVDTEIKVAFDSFEEYQSFIWNNDKMKRFAYKNLENINLHISQALENDIVKLNVETNDINTIVNQFYAQQDNILPFNPRVFNKKHDFYRLTRSLCSVLLQETLEVSNIWYNLNVELGLAYPFYIPNRFELTKDYDSVTGQFQSCIDVVDYLYKQIALTDVSFVESQTFGWEQIAGGTSEVNKDQVYNTISTNLKKIKKTKRQFITENLHDIQHYS
jgi:hypothetical protein